MKYRFPTDRQYDRSNHMWAQRDPDTGRVLVGMDALGVESLGDLAYITLPLAGERTTRGKASGTLEAAKMTGEMIAPVSGTIIKRNEEVLRNPALVNRDCYGTGWLLAIEPTDWRTESAQLVYGDAVEVWGKAEVERYRQQGWIHD